MQLSRIDLNSALARLFRPQGPGVSARKQREAAEARPGAARQKQVVGLLAALLGFLLLVVLLFVGAAFIGQAKHRAAESTIGVVSAPLPEATKPFSAEAGLAGALALARNWAGDAQLVQAQATMGGAGEFHLGEAAWSYLFYSAQGKTTALVVAGPDRTDLLSTRPAPGPLSVVDSSAWAIGSAEALEQFLARGGALFLDAYPQATLTLALTPSGGASWQGRLVDEDSGQAFHLGFDAATGALILEPGR